MTVGWLLLRQLVGRIGHNSVVSGVGSLRSVAYRTSILQHQVSPLSHLSCFYAFNNRSFSAVPKEEKTNKEGEKATTQETSKESTSPATLQDSFGFQLKTGTPDRMPSSFDQATGSERAELEEPDLYRNPEKYVNSRVMIAPFGTKEKPLLIPSRYDSRMIGCTGNYYTQVDEKR